MISDFDQAAAIFMIILVARLWYAKKLWSVLRGLTKFWGVYLYGTLIFIVASYYKNAPLMDALKKAIVGFIISFFAEHGIVAGPFYLILLFSYYSSGWI